jgi:hypothetical protein
MGVIINRTAAKVNLFPQQPGPSLPRRMSLYNDNETESLFIPKGHKFRLSRQAAQLSFKIAFARLSFYDR